MAIARKWIFPIIWIVIFAAIAAALVKLAFFPAEAEEVDPAFPSFEIVEPQYVVTTGTVRNDVTLSATIAADEAVPIPADLAGEVREVMVSAGQSVTAGQEILKIRAEVVNPDGTTGTEWSVVQAPANGTLSSFKALVGQTFAVGDPVGQIAPPTFHLTGSIPPEQLYRLITRPTEGQVTINGGPAPFTCTGLSIISPLAGSSGTSGGGDGAAGSGGPTIRCNIPAEVVVFAGLSAELVIAGGIADGVLIVPITAVEGASGSGNVYLVNGDGSRELHEVTLGLNDGVNVEVTDGLAEGDVILQFVPGAPSPDEALAPGCYPVDGGGLVCEG